MNDNQARTIEPPLHKDCQVRFWNTINMKDYQVKFWNTINMKDYQVRFMEHPLHEGLSV